MSTTGTGALQHAEAKTHAVVGAAPARLVRQHPLVAFFVLAYALSWFPWWFLYAAGLAPSPIAGFGPFLAALVVLPITHGRAGLRTLLWRMVRWRVGLRWYAVALLLPVAITGAAAGMNVLLGAPAPSPAQLRAWPGLFGTFVLLLLVPGIGGAWEEPGFRGYALPILQGRRSALVASFILGALWVGWHLPLFLAAKIQWSDVVFIPATAVVFTWVFNSTGGSVLIAMLLHCMNNTISGAFFGPMFSGADAIRQSWLFAVLWCLAAVVVVVVAGPERLSRHVRVPVVAPALPKPEPRPNILVPRGAGA
jgi:uncharacterized protein